MPFHPAVPSYPLLEWNRNADALGFSQGLLATEADDSSFIGCLVINTSCDALKRRKASDK